jgi:hypothetical protein
MTAKAAGGKDSLRVRARLLATRITIASLVALLVLLGWLVLGRMHYDGTERYSNNDLDPAVLSALDVGTDVTAVVYGDSEGRGNRLSQPTDEIGIAFLDVRGRYINPPTSLTGSWFYNRPDEVGGAVSAAHGTTSGVAIVYTTRDSHSGRPTGLRCVRVDALSGAISPAVEPIPGLGMGGMEFQSVSWGDALHVLVWRHYDLQPEYVGYVQYVRSTDGGRTWQSPIRLLAGNVSATWSCLVARGDIVSALLLGVRDPVKDWNVSTDLLVQSVDGGAAFGSPIALTGDTIPKEIERSVAAQGEDGHILLNTVEGQDSGGQASVFRLLATGDTDRIALPSTEWAVQVNLVMDDAHPQSFRADVCTVPFFDPVDHTAEIRIYDLDGGLLSTTALTDSYYMWLRHDLSYVRAVDGKRIGIEAHSIDVSHGDVAKGATELLLFEEDTVTKERVTIGKPYEVVFEHSDAEMAKYRTRTSSGILAAWLVLIVLLTAGLVASRLSDSAPDKEESVRWVEGLLYTMAALLPLSLIAGIIAISDGAYWHSTFNFFGLFYVIAGVLMVEMRARISSKVPPPRLLQVPFAAFGMLLVALYSSSPTLDDDLYFMAILLLMFMIWPLLVVLPILILRRFAREMAPGEHKILLMDLRIGLLLILILSLFVPPLVWMGFNIHPIP